MDSSKISNQPISRRTALGLGGIAAVVGASMVSVSAPALAASTPQIVNGVSGTVPAILASSKFPIAAYWPGHPYATTDAVYAGIATAGFNLVLGNPYLMAGSASTGALEYAAAHGLQYVVYDQFTMTYTDGPIPLTSAQANSSTQATTASYGSYSAFGGLYLNDEVLPGRAAYLAPFHAAVRSANPLALPYMNLLPAEYPSFGPDTARAANYTAYVQDYIDTVGPTFLSTDSYPLLYDGTDNTTAWYQTLSIIRDRGIANGLQYWGFIQSIGFGHIASSPSSGNRVPTAAEIRWQANTLLVFGYSGIQYFTYWTPDPLRAGLPITSPDRANFFTGGLVSTDGAQGALWNAAKDFNPQLQQNGALLKGQNSLYLQNVSATPTADNIWTVFPDIFVASSTRASIWLGQFGGNTTQNARLFFFANQSHTSQQSTTITFNSGVTSVTNIGATVYGTTANITTSGGTYSAAVSLGPGESVLLRIAR